LKVAYTEEAIADIVEAITYLNERNVTAAAILDAEIARCIERLADREFEGPISRLRSGAVVRSWGVPPFRIYYQRHPDELLIVRGDGAYVPSPQISVRRSSSERPSQRHS
jgi:plasmid stabilization system protein ParE